MPTEKTDEELLAAFQQGDVGARTDTPGLQSGRHDDGIVVQPGP